MCVCLSVCACICIHIYINIYMYIHCYWNIPIIVVYTTIILHDIIRTFLSFTLLILRNSINIMHILLPLNDSLYYHIWDLICYCVCVMHVHTNVI